MRKQKASETRFLSIFGGFIPFGVRAAALRGLRFEKPNEDTKNLFKIHQKSIKNGSWRHLIFEGSRGRFSNGFWCILGGPGGSWEVLGGFQGVSGGVLGGLGGLLFF